jgi:dUTPase
MEKINLIMYGDKDYYYKVFINFINCESGKLLIKLHMKIVQKEYSEDWNSANNDITKKL